MNNKIQYFLSAKLIQTFELYLLLGILFHSLTSFFIITDKNLFFCCTFAKISGVCFITQMGGHVAHLLQKR